MLTNGQKLVRELYLDNGLTPPESPSVPDWAEVEVASWTNEELEIFASGDQDDPLVAAHPRLSEWLNRVFGDIVGPPDPPGWPHQ